MKTPLRIAAAVGLFVAAASPAGAAPDPAIALYTATYKAEYEGRDVGTTEFSVGYDASSDVYTFQSRTTVKGLVVRMAFPNPVLERSTFRVVDGAIQPIEMSFEDGSRKGEDNLKVAFDWAAGTALVTAGGTQRTVALTPGTLDRGTLQVALMRDLAAGRAPGPYKVVDEDSLQEHRYADEGAQATASGRGTLDTRLLVRRREGSSRTTWIYATPSLRFLPARIEQRRDAEVRSAFTLEKVEGL